MSAPYRLLVVATSADRSELALFDGLRGSGVSVGLVIDPGSPRREAVRKCFPDVGFLRIRHRFDLAAALTLRRRIAADPPDILYAPSNRPLSVSLLATRGLPTRVVAYRGTIGHLSRWDPAAWMTYLHPRLAHIICVSDAVETYLRDRMRLPPARLTRIYKGHDPSWYDGSPERRVTRGEIGIPDDALAVGFVGRIRPVKGVDILIRALDYLPSGIHLLLVGQIDDPRVKRFLRRPGPLRERVHVTGHSDNILGLLDLCDVFAMPSVAREGLPRAVVEAMCRRIPVVVSSAGGLPELVAHGKCGLIVPPRNAQALAEAIRRLACDTELRRRLSAAARERIETHFHIEQTLRRTLALHRSLLARG